MPGWFIARIVPGSDFGVDNLDYDSGTEFHRYNKNNLLVKKFTSK